MARPVDRIRGPVPLALRAIARAVPLHDDAGLHHVGAHRHHVHLVEGLSRRDCMAGRDAGGLAQDDVGRLHPYRGHRGRYATGGAAIDADIRLDNLSLSRLKWKTTNEKYKDDRQVSHDSVLSLCRTSRLTWRRPEAVAFNFDVIRRSRSTAGYFVD